MKKILDKFFKETVAEIKNLSKKPEEITFRSGKNLVIKSGGSYYTTNRKTSAEEVTETLKRLCNMSVYAYMDQLKNGFVSLEGGHRVGICGTAVIRDNTLHNIKDINSVNIRIASEAEGCSDKINLPAGNMLIISPPGCGKTTMLRDICRRLGKVHKVSIVDERGEIAGICGGVAGFNVGEMTDVMSLCDKKYAMELMLRSMSPDYIVTDEIGDNDAEVLKKAVRYGVNIIASAHGKDYISTLKRLGIDNGMFDTVVILNNKNGPGNIERIYKGGSVV